MKKVKFYAIGNEESFNYYVFEKKDKAIEEVSKVLIEIFKEKIYLFSHYEDKNKKEHRRKINFEKEFDEHQTIASFKKDKTRIDIFYGKKKAFLTIHCSLDLRKKFNEKLARIMSMPKIKKSSSSKK
ncbi:hypothetical protein KA107_01840 [Candidatus Pacearchaeota archaeon]|nr:hypothetical protein [Candidatus Pacearchaeota archaeon]